MGKMPRLLEIFVVREDSKNDVDEWAQGWNLKITPENRETVIRWRDLHKKMVKHGPNQSEEEESNYLMFVDDMEGVGLIEALEDGDLQTAEIVSKETLRKYPPGGYNAFAGINGQPGSSEPEKGGNN